MKPIVSQPAVEGAITPSFEGKQQSQRDHFARVKSGLGMFFYVKHLVINTAKQINDKIFAVRSLIFHRYIWEKMPRIEKMSIYGIVWMKPSSNLSE